MRQYDAAIVGGGPAGATIGFLLQRRGFRTCIVDRSVFPRDKLCGGMLTEKTVRLLREIYGVQDFPRAAVTSEIEVYWNTERVSRASLDTRFHLVERRAFDNELLERYRAAGGETREGVRVANIDRAARELALSDGSIVRYRILVGADGAGSQVRRLVDADYHPGAFCVEANGPEDAVSDAARIYFAVVPGGYGWRFPKGNHDTVGLGGEIVPRDWKSALEQFARDSGAPVDALQIRGALISDGHYVPRPYGAREILIGDAAGLVDPVTGEGLYFALRSARYAATAVRAFLRDGVPFERTYGVEIRDIHAIMDSGNRFRRLLYLDWVQPILLRARKTPRKEHLVTKRFCEDVLSDYRCTYGQFFWRYLWIRVRQSFQRDASEKAEKRRRVTTKKKRTRTEKRRRITTRAEKRRRAKSKKNRAMTEA